jgi:hypothetical protein
VAPAAGALGRAATVLWVTAAHGARDRAPGRAGGVGRAGVELLVVSPFPRAGRAVAFTVAGCAVQAIPAGARARAA